MPAKAQGYDRPIHESEDKFGRRFLVDNIYDLLMVHDAKWSVGSLSMVSGDQANRQSPK
jgi:hypothetical protein